MRNYKRTTLQKPLTPAILEEAKKLIESGLSVRKAASSLGFDESTLRKRLKKGEGVLSLGRFKSVFSPGQEQEIVNHCKQLDLRFYGLTLKSLRYLAYQYAEKNRISHQFNKQSKMAGRDWTRTFMKRNKLSLRTPRKTSVSRAMGFNKIQLANYFDNLESILHKFKFSPNRIYNMDESGFQTVPNKLPRHVAPVGKREVAKSVSAEQGQTVTVVCCMSASGHFVPPYFIFARKRENLLLKKDGPIGCEMAVTDTAYMNTPTFVKWLEHFKNHVNPSEEQPTLLILDNHISHVSIEAITFARKNHIHLLSIPPHSSHRTQPLDRNFFRPLKALYDEVCDNWCTSHPGEVITVYHVAGLFKVAYERTATVEKAVTGFRVTGIYPLNRNVFTDEDFLPASVTDQPMDVIDQSDEDVNVFIEFENEIEMNVDVQPCRVEEEAHSQNVTVELPIAPIENYLQDDRPYSDSPKKNASPLSLQKYNHRNMSTAGLHSFSPKRNVEPINIDSPNQPSCSGANNYGHVSPVDIIPLSKLQKPRNRSGKGLKSTILTGTPHKEILETLKNEKEIREQKIIKRKLFTLKRKSEKKIRILNKKTNRPNNAHKMFNQNKDSCDSTVACPGCMTKYVEPPTEEWIQCKVCKEWWHEECSLYEGGEFVCDLC